MDHKRILMAIIQHIRSTAIINMIIKAAICSCFFVLSLWWLPAIYICGILLCAIIVIEFDYKSIVYLFFFMSWRYLLDLSFFFAVALYLGICVIKIILKNRGEKKEISLFEFLIAPICFFILMAAINSNISWLLLGGIFIFVCCSVGEKLDFKQIVYWYIFGIILSCLVGLFVEYIPFLAETIAEYRAYGLQRFSGLTSNPNTLSVYSVCGICALLVLDFKKRLKAWEFFPLLAIMFGLGLATLSRTFILAIMPTIAAYIILRILREKKQSIKPIALLALTFLITCGVLYNYTLAGTMRYGIIPERDIIVNDTPIRYYKYGDAIVDDPGRLGLWERNINDWLSSPQTFFFGRGIDSHNIGNMDQHNLAIFLLVKTGIIGLSLFVLFFILIFYTLYKVKKYKLDFATLLFLLTAFFSTITETLFPGLLFLIFIIFYILSAAGEKKSSS